MKTIASALALLFLSQSSVWAEAKDSVGSREGLSAATVQHAFYWRSPVVSSAKSNPERSAYSKSSVYQRPPVVLQNSDGLSFLKSLELHRFERTDWLAVGSTAGATSFVFHHRDRGQHLKWPKIAAYSAGGVLIASGIVQIAKEKGGSKVGGGVMIGLGVALVVVGATANVHSSAK